MDDDGDYVASMGGTSMAAPLAASVGALVWSKNPGWTAAQVEQHLYDTADDIDGLACNSEISTLISRPALRAISKRK